MMLRFVTVQGLLQFINSAAKQFSPGGHCFFSEFFFLAPLNFELASTGVKRAIFGFVSPFH